MNKMYLKDKNNKSGQALLFVVVVMTIALAIGIGVSVRTIGSLQRTTQTDTAARVQAAAEAGVERFLLVPNSQLNAIANNPSEATCSAAGDGIYYDPDLAGGGCVLEVDVSSTLDTITSTAVVNVTPFTTTSNLAGDHYSFDVAAGDVKEVNLEGYVSDQISICWKSYDVSGSDLYYVVYDQDGIETRGGLNGNVTDPEYVSEGFAPVLSGNGAYTFCGIVSLGDTLNYGLRIRSLSGASNVGVYPLSDELPGQGYKITSIGVLLENEQVTQTVTAYKSLPYLPAIFDFGVYGQTVTN